MTAALVRFLADDDATAQLGAALGRALRKGDAVFLIGDLGAGKSALARAAIRAAMGAEVDAPSPTFTLVQSYDAPQTVIHHFDLYRLTDPEEVIETGLEAALEDGACLIEWPDRLGWLAPEDRLEVALRIPEGGGRRAALAAAGPRAAALLARVAP